MLIKNLRKKFTIIAMCSMFVVLATIVGILNIANYCGIVQNADKLLAMIADNDGIFPSPPESGNAPRERSIAENGREQFLESAYDTRYFTVRLDEKGKAISFEMGHIAAVGFDKAEEYAQKVLERKSYKGFEGIYRYRQVVSERGKMVIFLDRRREIASFKSNLLISITVSAVGLFAVFVLVLFFSKIVFRPVADSYKRQKQFITDASHEIKTPLTVIEANTEVIEMEYGENEWTKSICRQIQRLTVLTNQLIAMAKLEEGGNVLAKESFSLSEAVIESVESFSALALTKGKQLEVKIEEDISFVGNEKAICHLISILLDNGIKYSVEGSKILVSLERKRKKTILRISNEAENIPQGNLDILFERFYRLDSSRNSQTGGSGIGLSVAQAIVQSHRGKITVASEDGKNLVVCVEFK